MQSYPPMLSRTDLALNDKVYRLRNKIEGRSDYFIDRITKAKETKQDPRLIEKMLRITSEYKTYISRLDIYKLQTNTYTEIYDIVKEWPDRKEHLKNLFGLNSISTEITGNQNDHFIKMLAEGAIQGSYQRVGERLKIAMHEALQKNWFLVFSTLTVSPDSYSDVFKKGSQQWRTYIRTIQRKVAKEAYGSYRKAEGQHYFDYFAVIEEGGTTGRLHIHCLMMMKTGLGFTDPNLGLPSPTRREIKELVSYWQYGFSSHIPVRFSQNDAFGKLNWRWPTDTEGKPIENSQLEKVAGYLVKYILKSKRAQLTGEIQSWKIRMSKNLGKTSLYLTLSMMKQKHILSLAALRKYPTLIKLYGNKIPSKLIRQMAVREMISRLNQRKKLWNDLLPKDTRIKTLMKNATQNITESSLMSSTDLMIGLLSNEVTFKGIEVAFIEAKRYIEKRHPKGSYYTQVHGGIIER